MIHVPCPHCSLNNKVVFNQKLMGKKVLFNCKNPACKKPIAYTFPDTIESLQEDYKTIITDYSKTVSSTGHIKWNNQNTDEELFIELVDGVNIIGRQSKSKSPDISIPSSDKSMSRMHCVIIKSKEAEGYAYLLKGYGNKNPIKLNGKEIKTGTEIYLENGDNLSLGITLISFHIL